MAVIIRRLRKTKRRLRFLRRLSRDLKFIGQALALRQKGSTIILELHQRQPATFAHAHRRIHRATTWDSRDEIRALECRVRSQLAFADLQSLSVGKIHPKIALCETQGSLELFDYLRRYQTVPSNPCVGATLKALVYDHGQSGSPKIMGILALASAMYFQGARDRYLGWKNPQTGKTARTLRERGLKACLHVATCMAVPPYDGLRCGRILAMMCFSDVLQEAFTHKFGYGYIALTAGASLQNYAVLFDRLHLKRLHEGSDKAHLYIKLRSGQPSYALLSGAVSSMTFVAASQLRSRQLNELKSRQSRMRALSFALADCGLTLDIFRGNRTATYFGTIKSEYVEDLRSGKQPSSIECLTVDRIMAYWRNRFAEGATQQLERGSVRSARLLSRGMRNPHRRAG